MKSRIVQARELAGLSQKELAAEMGISPSTLNGYERGKHDPKSDGLTSISKICGVTVDFLLNLSDTPNKTGPAIPTPPKQNTGRIRTGHGGEYCKEVWMSGRSRKADGVRCGV